VGKEPLACEARGVGDFVGGRGGRVDGGLGGGAD